MIGLGPVDELLAVFGWLDEPHLQHLETKGPGSKLRGSKLPKTTKPEGQLDLGLCAKPWRKESRTGLWACILIPFTDSQPREHVDM